MTKVVYFEPHNPESVYIDSSGKEHKSVAHPDAQAFEVKQEVVDAEPSLVPESEYKEAIKAQNEAAKEADNQPDTVTQAGEQKGLTPSK